MAKKINPVFGKIGNALKSTAADHVLAEANDIYDVEKEMYQSEINQLVLQGSADDSTHFFISTTEYAELCSAGTVTLKDGTVLMYDENAYYALYEDEE
jgi:hypothetical protein